MDIVESLSAECYDSITCVDMHTTGEPTRIVISGYPSLTGTLFEQRTRARTHHDNIRKCLLLEPRGHFDMYGAVLRPVTELTRTGKAHIGVLFMTNDGYSTMCGHATIALGRFLLDTHDKTVFPNRDNVKYDPATKSATLKLHAPCGLLDVTVPVTIDGQKSDPSRPVTFVSVPSFATGIVWSSQFHSIIDGRN
jgi:trans-L-3-hydroxyproline dehydratase